MPSPTSKACPRAREILGIFATTCLSHLRKGSHCLLTPSICDCKATAPRFPRVRRAWCAPAAILASLSFSSLAKTWGERITVALQPGAAA